MSTFLRKAIGLFIELDEAQADQASASGARSAAEQTTVKQPAAPANQPISQAELSKFEKHFDQLFEQTNLPGPDYFEFWKTMETLEAHIPEEKARIKAVFASLKIQGLTKVNLIDTATKYRDAVLLDKANFESAVQSKSESEISGREASIQKMETEREDKRQTIEKLQREIEESAAKIASLQQEIAAEREKIDNAQRGYLAACNAMVSKIENDIQQFQQIIE
jgi:chromosome segregation ATPase